ncbi:uncharacterized protein PGTG_14160 [Puccinia graminis f. sp. tritici CRL 75-36-700-3]|uniref:Uncharacterized protein n=1 Tax=Puccinia graminis f. sp. tritici (strain CRL 75-36-700-3 / race SCCL) TaxID=418459 RepID=E3KX51_PUCGT|nr:uncharacterized protein PGTG_14160 [Puccinia graminis f. sp. tritici CRL 75-36-700-3]EFP88821.1 hypothetical protein PGTG_14160 [Puccinia graminis f. sp. tritici CRL 75-36-700-3]
MIHLRSITFVPEEPPFVFNSHYQILDAKLWSSSTMDVVPINSSRFPRFDILTPAPRGISPTAGSWLCFEGLAKFNPGSETIIVNCQASSYHSEVPLQYQHLPMPYVFGDLIIIETQKQLYASDPDQDNLTVPLFFRPANFYCARAQGALRDLYCTHYHSAPSFGSKLK